MPIIQKINPNGKTALNSDTESARLKRGVLKKMMIKLSCKAVMVFLLLKNGTIQPKLTLEHKLTGDMLFLIRCIPFPHLCHPDTLLYLLVLIINRIKTFHSSW